MHYGPNSQYNLRLINQVAIETKLIIENPIVTFKGSKTRRIFKRNVLARRIFQKISSSRILVFIPVVVTCSWQASISLIRFSTIYV